MPGLPGLEKSANDRLQRTGDGSVLPTSEIDLVAVPLPNRLQHGLNPLAHASAQRSEPVFLIFETSSLPVSPCLLGVSNSDGFISRSLTLGSGHQANAACNPGGGLNCAKAGSSVAPSSYPKKPIQPPANGAPSGVGGEVPGKSARNSAKSCKGVLVGWAVC